MSDNEEEKRSRSPSPEPKGKKGGKKKAPAKKAKKDASPSPAKEASPKKDASPKPKKAAKGKKLTKGRTMVSWRGFLFFSFFFLAPALHPARHVWPVTGRVRVVTGNDRGVDGGHPTASVFLFGIFFSSARFPPRLLRLLTLLAGRHCC